MDIFKEVKAQVTARQAAELYGLQVNRYGMAKCIFHDDHNPSMKIDRRYHCFGCQADGDVDQVLIAGGTPEEVVEFKKEYVTKKVAECIHTHGPQPGIFASILQQAIIVLKQFLHFLMFRQERAERSDVDKGAKKITDNASFRTMGAKTTDREQVQAIVEDFDPAELQRVSADYLRLKNLYDDLDALNRKIYAIDKTITGLNRQLKKLKITFVDKILHAPERKELKKMITAEKAKLADAKGLLELYPAEHGFFSVMDIKRAYRSSKKKYDELQERRYNNQSAQSQHWSAQKRRGEETSQIGCRKELDEEKMIYEKQKPHHTTSAVKAIGEENTSTGEKRKKASILARLAEKQFIVEETKGEGRRASVRSRVGTEL